MSLAVSSTVLCAYAAAAGALSHWTYFLHGEHHLSAPYLLRIALLIPIVTSTYLWKYTVLDAVQAITLTAQLGASYYAALYTSILLYRVFFHRLRAFPGPFAARATKLWHVWKLAPNSKNYKELNGLRETYGDYVRTGEYFEQYIPVHFICLIYIQAQLK